MKVYVVEVGAYSDRYVDSVFTTRELAESYIVERARRSSHLGRAAFVERGSSSFDEWTDKVDRGRWNVYGDVQEYELWDALPIADAVGVG